MLADDQKVEFDSAGGMLVYRDAALPTLFYYASTRPAIARAADGSYQLSLVHYDRPIGDKAAMLSFVASLEPDAAAMDNMRSALAQRYPNLKLAFEPMSWSDGLVAASVAGGAAVTATPSLLGQNPAALALGLSTDQYLLLKAYAAAPSGPPPLSLVYSLSYAALRPAYAASIAFDAAAFRDWVQKRCSANLLFISFDRIDTFEQLRRDAVLRVQSENQTGEAVPDGLRLAFLASLQSVLEPLPRFAPAPQAETGAGNWLVGFDCSSVHDVQSISRRIDSNMHMTGVVSRKAVLQGAPIGLAEALARQPDTELSTTTGFIQPLTVRCHDGFGGQPLRQANVLIAPAPSGEGFASFTARTDEWNTRLTRAPGAAVSYTYDCTLYFDPAATAGDPGAPCRSGAQQILPGQAYLDVVPSRWYSYRQYLASVADDFPWDLVDAIKLELSGPAPLSFAPASLDIGKYTPALRASAFAPAPADLDAVIYQATVTPRIGAKFCLSGQPAGSVIFLNPLQRRVVRFRAAPDVDWRNVAAIDISLLTADGNPQLWRNGKLSLTPGQPQCDFTYWYAFDPSLSFKTRLRTSNGAALEQPPARQSRALDIVIAQLPDLPPVPSPTGETHDLH